MEQYIKISNFITMGFFAGGDSVKRNKKQLEGRTAAFVKKSLTILFRDFFVLSFLFHAL